MSGIIEKTKEALGIGHHHHHSGSSSSLSSSSSTSTGTTNTGAVSYNAEGGMLNQQGSGFGASAANIGAPGATVDPTMGTGTYGSSSSYSSSSSSTLGSTGTGHHHGTSHHHHGSSSALSSGSLSSGTYGSSSSMSTGAYGSSSSYASGSTTGAYGTGHDNAMTRSEEQILIGKERVETGQAALRKTIETEHVETNIPLVKEKVVLQREPITEANRSAAYSGPELKESVHVVKTAEERPVVEKEVVAKERVRLDKVAEVTNLPVGGDIRKERIDVISGGAPMANVATGTTSGAISGSNLRSGTTGSNVDSDLYNKDRVGSGTTHRSDVTKNETNY